MQKYNPFTGVLEILLATAFVLAIELVASHF